MNNGMIRNAQYTEPKKDEEKKEEIKSIEYETTNISAESMTDIAKMVSSMLEGSSSYDVKHLHEKYHELDKRILVLENLFDYIKHNVSK